MLTEHGLIIQPRRNYEKSILLFSNLTKTQYSQKPKSNFNVCKSSKLIDSDVQDNHIGEKENKKNVQVADLKTLLKKMAAKEKIKKFISKLKRNQFTNKEDIQIQYDFVRQAERYNMLNTNGREKDRQGVVLSEKARLAISLSTFFSVIYIQILSSFQCFLDDFRISQLGSPWIIATQYICLLLIVAKMVASLVVQTTTNGYKLIQLSKIIKNYVYSMQFGLDLIYVVSIVFLLRSESDVSEAAFAYFVCLLRLRLTDRLDEVISNHLMLDNTKRQYLSLIRLLLMNLFLAHLLATVFLWISLIHPDQNWMTLYGIDSQPWFQKYTYSVYWAVTILSTVGFGDIIVANNQEAILVTFVMLFGCLILSYNISQVAGIFQNLKGRQEELQNQLHMLRRIAHITKISDELHRQIADYLIHATEIKNKYQIQAAKELISKLPEHLRQDYLEQSSHTYFLQMPFLSLLHIQTKKQIVEALTSDILSPGEMITHKRQGITKIYMLRMGTIGLAYNKDGSKINGLSIDTFTVKDSEECNPILLNAFLLNKGKSLNYSITCETYCSIAHLQFQSYIQCLKQCPNDFQFCKQYEDSDEALEQEWSPKLCNKCNERHSIFNCPKVHFMPLKSLVFLKDSRQKKQKLQFSSRDTLIQLNYYMKNYLDYVRQFKNKRIKQSSLKNWINTFSMYQNIHGIALLKCFKPKQQKKSKNNKENKSPIDLKLALEHKEIDVDILCDFDHYFNSCNPKNLQKTPLTSYKLPGPLSFQMNSLF